MIKKADFNDISAIEEILLDAVIWMKNTKLENQWTEESVKWTSLSKDYDINNFYIYYKNETPAGCVAITDLDTKYFPDIKKGESLYLHKLAVKRNFAGKNISKILINFVKDLSIKKGINCVRLDCNAHRAKLRTLYENEQFTYIGNPKHSKTTPMALYVWTF